MIQDISLFGTTSHIIQEDLFASSLNGYVTHGGPNGLKCIIVAHQQCREESEPDHC